jgi:signal transduction histidine kinase/ligand-binding sensor domain-containing protein
MNLRCRAVALLGWAWVCCCAWMWCSHSEGAPSNGVESVASEYIVDAWQTEQGLPDNFINAIAQTPEGYLWIATFNGLARFNGMQFVVFTSANTPELPSSRITKLHLDKHGRLWIISEYGQVSGWSEGRFKLFGEAEGLPKEDTGDLIEDHAGEIWVSSSFDATNYYHLRGSVFDPVSSTNSLFSRFGRTPDIHGYGWGVRNNRLFSVQPLCVDVEIPSFHPQGWRLAAARDGGMWMIADRIRKYSKNGWDDFGALPVSTDQFGQCIEDRNGNLWVGMGAGELWRVSTNHVFRRFKLPDGTNMELGRSIFEDAEGNLWIGNGGEGLVRLKPRAFRTYDSRDGLASDVVRSVARDRDGNVWLATVNNVDWFAPGDSEHAQNRSTGIGLPWTVYGARDGGILVGTYAEGLWRASGPSGPGTWFRETGRPNSMGPVMNAIFESRDGQVYLGTPQGIYGVENSCLVVRQVPSVPELDVRAFAESPSGDMYVGLNGGGLLRHGRNGWEHFTSRDGLADDHIWALYVDAEDRVWIGTSGRGLSLFEAGKFYSYSAPTGDPVIEPELPNVINNILEDDLGQLWLGSNQGLYRVNRRQLSEIAAGRTNSADVTRYDRADGMGSSQCTGDMQPTACKTPDGKLWFATMKGVTVVDPHLLPFNSRPPPVVVESVLVDDKPRPVFADSANAGGTAGETLKLVAGVHRLEFHYAGLSFTAPDKVRFRYQLERFDNAWNDAGTRRVAYYTKVPPGNYRFRVLACNNDNVWNETGASLAVVIVPEFWQRPWFQAATAVAAVGLLLGVFKLRLVQIERKRLVQETFSRRLLESQENERKRIASELHDSLGQSLLVMKNYAVMALRETATPDKMREQLGEISTAASSSIEEVRSISRALRPYQLDRFGLTKTLEDAAELLAKTSSLKIETQIEDVDRLFPPEAEISIYRVIQEWLSNVLKHARASTARVVVRKEAGMVRVLLEDDGIGFDPAAVANRSGPETGFGLANLQERLRLLGGILKIDSAPGTGTRLTADIPYEEPNHRSDR